MAAGRILVRDLIALDGNANPYAGALMYTYSPGTTSNRTTYQDSSLDPGSVHTNPVEADAGGKFPDVWVDLNTPYRIVIKSADDAVTLNDTDDVYGQGQNTNPTPRLLTSTTTLSSADLNTRIEVTGTWTLTLPLGSTLPAGWRTRLANTGTGTITIAPSGSDVSEVSTLRANDLYELTWDGSEWQADYLGGGQGKHLIPIMASAMRPQTTNGAALTVVEMSTNQQMLASFDFDTSTKEYAQFAVPMPKSAAEGTVTFRARLTQGSAGSGGVAISLQGLALSDDDAIDAAWGTAVTVTKTLGTAYDLYITDESAAVTPAGSWAEGDTVFFRVAREVGDDADTLALDAKLLGIDLFVTTNAPNDY